MNSHLPTYSDVPNNRVGWNKRVGWKFAQKTIIVQDEINVQVGKWFKNQ